MRLSDLAACFEGVIPSIIATASADGMPNISYLSHVVQVDEDHVALSNQFFAKTAANIRANPGVTLILVDCVTGDQFLLAMEFSHSIDSGPLFEKIALQLKATSDQIGLSQVMRLRSADVFRVIKIEDVPSTVSSGTGGTPRSEVKLPVLAAAVKAIDRQEEAEPIIDELLGAVATLGYHNSLVLILDAYRGELVTTGSAGYEPTGLGSEVSVGVGLIGSAAASGQTIKVSDMSRVRRFGEAILPDSGKGEGITRSIALPHLQSAMSQIAIPLLTRSEVRGVLFVESEERFAFRAEDEAALEILAGAAANSLRTIENELTGEDFNRAQSSAATNPTGPDIQVIHHRADDSIFVNNVYIIKGIAGAMVRLMVEWHLKDGRTEFTNREMRLALGARMPEIKDNLESRLLLLRRRLAEKQAPIRLSRIGRGRLSLQLEGPVLLEQRSN